MSDDDRQASIWIRPDGVAVYRASSLYGCTTAAVAVRLGFEETDPPEWMLQRYQAGHDHEPLILRRLTAEYGWRMSGSTQLTIDPIEVGRRAIITGHVDEIGSHEFYGPAIIEAKAFAQSTFESWMSSHWEGFPYYAWQVSVYMHAFGLPAVFAVKNKNTDDFDVTVLTEPLVPLTKIKARVAKIEALALKGLPVGCDRRQFPCPVWYLHTDEEVATEPDELRRVRLTALATAYDQARADEKRSKERLRAAAEDLKAMVVVGEKVALDEFVVGVSEATGRASFNGKAAEADYPEIEWSRYWSRGPSSTRITVNPTKGKK